MASLDKLIFTIYDNDNFSNPVTLLLNDLNSNSGIIFDFFENASKVTIQVVSNTYKVYVETPIEDDWEPTMKGMHLLDKKEYVLSSDDNPLFPQQYRIIITDGIRSYYKSYKVRPLQAISTDESYEALKHVISSFSDSLLYDESKRKVIAKGKKKNDTQFLPAICEELINNYDIISSSIIRIKRNPIVNLEKELGKTNKFKEQNEKAIIKSIQSQYQKYYASKTIENYNCLENMSLRFYLHESASLLTSVSEKVARTIQHLIKSMLNINKIINEKKKKINNPKITNARALQKKVNKLQKSLDSINARINRYQVAFDKINDLFIAINEFEYNSFLTNIRFTKCQLNNKFLKTMPYNLIYTKLYLPLIGSTIAGGSFGENGMGYSYKSTSSLYEIYCLLILVKVLESLGFTRSDIDVDTGLLDLDVIDGDISIDFYGKNYSCKLIYDQIIPNFDEINEEQDGLVVVDSRNQHNRPDYQLLFYNDDDELIYCMVLDAKCRKFNSIDVDGVNYSNKEIKSTILEYIQFRYHEADAYLLNGLLVNDLVILYPEEQLKSDIMDNRLGVHYISLSPSKDFEKRSSFESLKRIIINNINDL